MELRVPHPCVCKVWVPTIQRPNLSSFISSGVAPLVFKAAALNFTSPPPDLRPQILLLLSDVPTPTSALSRKDLTRSHATNAFPLSSLPVESVSSLELDQVPANCGVQG